jgi:hypothetical protein
VQGAGPAIARELPLGSSDPEGERPVSNGVFVLP